MAKMPKNDNLVMESIEDLFQQADIVSENPSSAPSQLSREKAGKIPIIGARAVTLEKDSPPGSDILVLAGQKRPLSEQSEPFFSAPSKKEGVADPRPSEAAAIQPESEDPFLAIRQAVISASDPDSPQTINSSEQKKDSAPAGITDNDTNPLGDQKFADQIARLIDREIELRLKAQLSILTLANHPAKAATQAEKPEKKSREKTARKPAPKKAQTKKAKTDKLATKKSTTKRAGAKKALTKQTGTKKTPAKKTARTPKKS
jgi:ribonuclease E